MAYGEPPGNGRWHPIRSDIESCSVAFTYTQHIYKYTPKTEKADRKTGRQTDTEIETETGRTRDVT